MRVLLICNYKPGVGGISGQVELLQKHLREEGHVADIFSTKASVMRRLLLPPRLSSVAKRYDVLHIHCCSGWGFLPAVLGISVGRRLDKRIVLTYHGGGGEKFFDKQPRLVKQYLTRTDANIVLSGFLAKVFDKHQLPYSIIPNIIELDESHYCQRDVLKPHFICTRAHEPLYNIPCILRAFQRVLTELSLTEKSESIRISQSELKELSEPISQTEKNELPEATLTLVGDGSQHETLMQMANEMGLKDVIFTGRVYNSEIYKYLDHADIMLSAPTVDNMPVSILEGMNAGLLVISSNVGGVPYMVEDGKTGYLFPSDNSDALADLMIKAVRQQAESKNIIREAHQAVNTYRWENIKEQLYSIYGIHS